MSTRKAFLTVHGEAPAIYRHPVYGLAWLLNRRVRRGVVLGFTLATAAGERMVGAGSLEEKEWRLADQPPAEAGNSADEAVSRLLACNGNGNGNRNGG